jgi:apolipoprotein N-acyltransferase
MEDSGEPKGNRAMTSAGQAARSGSWLAHAILLALVVGYIGMSALQSTPDANIGVALGLIALDALALPWSLPLLASEGGSLASGMYFVLAACGAALNLTLHAVVLGRRRKRFRPEQ